MFLKKKIRTSIVDLIIGGKGRNVMDVFTIRKEESGKIGT